MSKFKINPALAELIADTQAMEDMVTDRAEEMADKVRTVTGPKGESDDPYVDNIEVESGRDDKGHRFARVNAKKFTSGWIEFGTIKMVAQAPLRRAAELLGLKVSVRKGNKGDRA